MIVAFLLMSAILMMSIQTSMATEKDIMSNDVIKQAFDNNVNKISCIPETIETIEVYDSRLDEKEIIDHAAPGSTDPVRDRLRKLQRRRGSRCPEASGDRSG